ncbi:MAG: (2Fe-2S)-binding protein, partial [Pseudomonadota bacterium]
SRMWIGDAKSCELIFNTPVENGSVRVWNNVTMKAATATPTEAERAAQKEFQRIVLEAFAQDFDIWANKAPALTIAALPTERNFARGRNWYRQFYNPRAMAAEYHAKIDGEHFLPHLAVPPPNGYLKDYRA